MMLTIVDRVYARKMLVPIYYRPRPLLVVLLCLCCWKTPTAEGIVFSLDGQSIPNNDMARISVYDFQVVSSEVDTSSALKCQWETPGVGRFTYACQDPDGDSPIVCRSSNQESIILSGDTITRGWSNSRADESSGQGIIRIHYIWRREQIPEEGYFSCYNFGTDANDPAGLYILYPITAVTATIEVEAGTSTFRVRCTSTGGRALNMAVSGPNGYNSDISSYIQPVGTRLYLGADNYTARTDIISSGSERDVYLCNITSATSTTRDVTVRVGVRPITSLRQTALTTVQVSWSPIPELPLSGYRVYYSLASGNGGTRTKTVAGADITTTEITGLTNGETYNISVEAISNLANVLPGVPEMRVITLALVTPEMVEATTEPSSVTVSWGAVEDTDRYTVTLSQVQGTNQQGLCPTDYHTASLIVEAPSTTVSIAVGEVVDYTATDMLRAFTTYEVTVEAVSDVRGTSLPSETRRVLTPQTSAGEAPGGVAAEAQSSREMNVQWSGLSTCRLVNGRITGYRIVYTANGGSGTIDVEVGDGEDWRSGGEVTLTGLTPSTEYSISVTAVNENGDIGVYSNPVTTLTMVELAVTSYTVSESDKVVEVCVNAVDSTPCPSTLSFTVTLSTCDQTAVSPGDYVAVEEELTFAPCESRRCVNVRLTDDLVNEPDETFSISLSSSPPHIFFSSPTAEVVVTNDDDRPKEVVFHPVNATGVRIAWSGSAHLHTALTYTASLSTTGTIMSQLDRVYPPGTTSDVLVMDNDITLSDEYDHNFTLHYIDNNPGTPTSATFSFDKKHFQIQFGPFHFCLEWGLEKTARIENQLKAYLVQIMRKSCTDCYILTPSFLRPGMFLCHSNPTKTTYRTTHVNPFSTTNSTHMVGIIQSWVSGAPSLVLDGLLVRVSATCPTSISHLDGEECETETSTDPGLGTRISQTLNTCALRNLGEEVCRLGGC